MVSEGKGGIGSSPRGFGWEAGSTLLEVGVTFCPWELETSTSKGEDVRKGAWNSRLEQRIVPERRQGGSSVTRRCRIWRDVRD